MMGCCLSNSSEPGSPYAEGAGESGSARAINEQPRPIAPPAPPAAVEDPFASPSSLRRRHRSRPHPDQPLAQHINKPLRRHEWTSRNRTWTPSALDRERRDFFDTRVTGRQEIWQAIHAALELMWEADAALRDRTIQQPSRAGREESTGPSEQGRAAALATAQTILTAVDITLPTGDLAQGAYDVTGAHYSLPEYIVSDPLNVSSIEHQPGSHRSFSDNKDTFTGGGDPDDRDESPGEDEAVRRRQQKGKAVADVRDQIQLRARLSEGVQDVVVSMGRSDSVGSVARLITGEAGLPSGKKIRIAYMGKILKEKPSLAAQGWKEGHIVNALVFDR